MLLSCSVLCRLATSRLANVFGNGTIPFSEPEPEEIVRRTLRKSTSCEAVEVNPLSAVPAAGRADEARGCVGC